MQMSKEDENFRDGICAQNTVRFGKITEAMVKTLKQYQDPKSIFYDLLDGSLRIEAKFSRVYRKADIPISEKTILDAIRGSVASERMVIFDDWQISDFDCNIQQVKPAEFEVLYYGLFFSDQIKIFKINSGDIKTNKNGGKISYSDKQHKGNNGEGQFHINSSILQTHLDAYLDKTLSYGEFYRMLDENIKKLKILT